MSHLWFGCVLQAASEAVMMRALVPVEEMLQSTRAGMGFCDYLGSNRKAPRVT